MVDASLRVDGDTLLCRRHTQQTTTTHSSATVYPESSYQVRRLSQPTTAIRHAFAVGSVSAANAEMESPSAEKMFVGNEPVFFSSDEASTQFLNQLHSSKELRGNNLSSIERNIDLVFPSVSDEGFPIDYEAGYVDAVAANATRCTLISSWLKDPSLEVKEAQALADEQFSHFSSIPAVAELSNVEEYPSILGGLAAESGLTQIEVEDSMFCGIFGTEGAEK